MTLVEEARKYLGQREVPGNMGFVDPAFEAEMIEESWRKTWAWCCVFIRVIAVNAFPEHAAKLRKLITPSVMQTFRNLRDAGYAISYTPTVGYICFYQLYKNGKPQGTGHVSVVSKANGELYSDISGNTNEAGSREGIQVGEKDHRLNTKVDNGLRAIGFIKLP